MKRIGTSRRKDRPIDWQNLVFVICFLIALGLVVYGYFDRSISSPEVHPVNAPARLSSSNNPSPSMSEQPMRSVLVDLSDFKVSVLDGQNVIATFPITHGRPTRETQPGDYQITNIVHDPLWDDPDTAEKESLSGELGSWWMDLYKVNGGIVGFYGLPPRRDYLVYDKIPGTSGCIGMIDIDNRKFRSYVSEGTPVHIQQ